MISFFLNEITTSSFFEPQNSEKQGVMLYAFSIFRDSYNGM